MEIGYKNGGAAEVYYFVTRNAQGDITAIYDAKTCTLVGSYTYDAWGRVLSATAVNDPNGITEKNPFRYRGYYYDRETGFYYLQSRYYDPGIGRFANADDPYILYSDQNNSNQYNLFTYCLNNPINNVDLNGYFAIVLGAAFELAIITTLCISLIWYVNTPSFQSSLESIYQSVNNAITSASTALAKGKSNPKDLEKGMSENQKEKFQRAIEDYKNDNGMPPDYNIPWPFLEELADEVKELYK